MNKNLIILAQATATFLRAAADALTDLLGDSPASPEQAATPEPEVPKRGRKPKADIPTPMKEAIEEVKAESQPEKPSEQPTEETAEATLARYNANLKLIEPLHHAKKGLLVKQTLAKYSTSSPALKGLPLDKQAAFEADIAALKKEHLPAEAAGPEGY